MDTHGCQPSGWVRVWPRPHVPNEQLFVLFRVYSWFLSFLVERRQARKQDPISLTLNAMGATSVIHQA